MEAPTQHPQPDRTLLWKVWAILVALALVSIVVGAPYQTAFLDETMAGVMALVWVTLLCVQGVPSLLLAALGLWLGDKVGLGAPMLRAWLAGERPLWKRFRRSLGIAVLAGLAAGAVLLLLSMALEPLFPESTASTEIELRLTALKGLGGSFMAAVTEELLFRLGLMTLLVWVGTALLRRTSPPAGLVWAANVLAVLPFGLVHLGNAAAMSMPITPAVLAFVLLLNGMAGVTFGWVYWKHGLEAAMLAHFSTDIVLHVLPYLFAGRWA